MKSLEKMLLDYKSEEAKLIARKEHINETIQISKKAFYEAEDNKCISYFEFLWQQGAYIKKQWWILQFLMLLAFWFVMCMEGTDFQLQRNMGVLASLFVIIMIPELWKSKTSGAMEIEGTTYYSLRQIYAARMCLFAIVDLLILILFVSTISMTTQMTIKDMLIQFLLPLNVNCCICCRILFSSKFGSEYIAVSLSVIWAAVWSLLIWNKTVFEIISMPVLFLCLFFSISYLAYCVNRTMKNCNKYWEVNPTWNWF